MCCGCANSEFSLVMGKTGYVSIMFADIVKRTFSWISSCTEILSDGHNCILKAIWRDKTSSLTAAHPDAPDCTGRQQTGEKWNLTVSLAQAGPRICICSCLKSFPFLSFYWGKSKLKGTLFVPCPSCLPSLNHLNHEWFMLWLSANGDSPLWDAHWAVLHEAVNQKGLSEVTTWCKSTKTKFLVEGVADEVLSVTNIWVWNRTDFGGKETSSAESQGPP